MKCECCGKKHNGEYGSGRFCSSECARSYSTTGRNIRAEINKKIKLTILNRMKDPEYKMEWMKKRENFFTREVSKDEETRRIKAIKDYWERYWDTLSHSPFDKLNKTTIKRVLMIEQRGKCARCGMDNEWCGAKLVLQLHHIDGCKKNNNRDNVCLLCPNCHSQTSSFAWKNAMKINKELFSQNCSKPRKKM